MLLDVVYFFFLPIDKGIDVAGATDRFLKRQTLLLSIYMILMDANFVMSLVETSIIKLDRSMRVRPVYHLSIKKMVDRPDKLALQEA